MTNSQATQDFQSSQPAQQPLQPHGIPNHLGVNTGFGQTPGNNDEFIAMMNKAASNPGQTPWTPDPMLTPPNPQELAKARLEETLDGFNMDRKIPSAFWSGAAPFIWSNLPTTLLRVKLAPETVEKIEPLFVHVLSGARTPSATTLEVLVAILTGFTYQEDADPGLVVVEYLLTELASEVRAIVNLTNELGEIIAPNGHYAPIQ